MNSLNVLTTVTENKGKLKVWQILGHRALVVTVGNKAETDVDKNLAPDPKRMIVTMSGEMPAAKVPKQTASNTSCRRINYTTTHAKSPNREHATLTNAFLLISTAVSGHPTHAQHRS